MTVNNQEERPDEKATVTLSGNLLAQADSVHRHH
jgi:hypothetical protein